MDSFALLSVEEMYRADALAMEGGIAGLDLMEAAGAAVASEIESRWSRRSVVVLCGPGNNGGDGFVAARLLSEKGWPVRVALLGARDKLVGDAAQNATRWTGDIEPLDIGVLDGCHLVVDALFGAGLARSLSGAAEEVIDAANERDIDIVAVDVPSGVSGNTGAVDGCAPDCVLTVTFFRAKPGHFLYPGHALCGDIVVADIGIPDSVLLEIEPSTHINDPALWKSKVPWPDAQTHKYGRGHAVIAGGADMVGAARMAAKAARRAGAGLATIACPQAAFALYAAGDPGTMVHGLENADAFAAYLEDSRRNSVLVGPGCGISEETAMMAMAAVAAKKACVLDADAISVFQGKSELLFSVLAEAGPGRCLLTPHDGEFKRLFAWEGDRLARARAAAAECGAVVLLKGPDTVIASPDGRSVVNVGAPPTLATAGSGDVLAGLALGLMAQGIGAFDAGCAAAWMHARAATLFGPGLIAEDLIDLMPDVLTELFDDT